MLVRFFPFLLISSICSSELLVNLVDNSDRSGHGYGHFRSTTAGILTTTNEIEGILGNWTEKDSSNNSTHIPTQDPIVVDDLPLFISNPWVRVERLENGLGNLSWPSKSIVPRLFSDMGRAGFPPLSAIMKWSCWDEVDEIEQEDFKNIFNEKNTKGEVKKGLKEWIIKYNGTTIADKIETMMNDFEDRMKLFSINFESALSTLSTAVRTFNDVALDDSMTIAESEAILNNIADILDKNFVKSLNSLFNGNVMNGKKLKKMIIQSMPTTTHKPVRRTFPPMSANTTGNGVWHGNWKRYTVIRRVTNKPNLPVTTNSS